MNTATTQTELQIEDLVRPDRIHRRVYTDPRIFDMEMERIFSKTWVYVGHESEVAQPGDYKTARIAGQPVILSRHQDGKVYVLYNRCMHRGAILCRESLGNSRFFRCIYHGWTYGSDGGISGVPFRGAYAPDFDFSEFNLMQVPRVASHRGFVFASLSPTGVSFEEYLGPAVEYLERIVDLAPDGEIVVSRRPHQYDYASNWKLQVENFSDFYHPSFTHESSFAATTQSSTPYNSQVSPDERGATIGYTNGHTVVENPSGVPTRLSSAPAEGFRGATTAEYAVSLAAARGEAEAKRLLSSVFHLVLFPNLVFKHDEQTFRVIEPISVDHTVIRVYAYRLKGAPESMNDSMLRRSGNWASAAGFGQPDDLEAFTRVAEGLQAKGPEWLIFARGIHRQTIGPNGEHRGPAAADEAHFRAQYQYWKKVMLEGEG